MLVNVTDVEMGEISDIKDCDYFFRVNLVLLFLLLTLQVVLILASFLMLKNHNVLFLF